MKNRAVQDATTRMEYLRAVEDGDASLADAIARANPDLFVPAVSAREVDVPVEDIAYELTDAGRAALAASDPDNVSL